MQKILVVDDHADVRHLLSLTLELDYEVLQARDAVEALQLARREKPFAVLLDVMMPGKLDGLDVLSVLKSDPATKDIVVGMVSARGQKEDITLAEAAGADAYFVKPFSPLQINEWLNRHAHASTAPQRAATGAQGRF